MYKNDHRLPLFRGRMLAVPVMLGLALFFLAGCQSDTLMPGSLLPTTPIVLPTATPTILPTETLPPTLPPPTILPTPLPTHIPTPEPVRSILFTGNSCSTTASNCSSSADSLPSENYLIYSDGTGLRPFIEIEGFPTVKSIVLSPDQSRVAFHTGDKFFLGDVGGDTYSEVAADISHFHPFSFYGNDPNCLAGFDDELENGKVVVTLYKSCIGDTEPTSVETTVLPTSRTGSEYLLSPEGDRWVAYTIGNIGLDNQAALYVHKIGDTNSPQPIFQQQPASYARSIHWQDNETLEFIYASGESTHDRKTYFYVIDWEGKELTTRYEMPALQEPPSESSISTNYYVPESGDWFADNDLFVFTIDREGGPTPAFNGLYVLNLITGETQQILSNYSVFTIRAWLPLSTNEE